MSEFIPTSFDISRFTETDLGKNERQFGARQRYIYSKLTAENGEIYFSKKLPGFDEVADKKWAKHLEREPVWADFAGRVAAEYPELKLASLMPVSVEPSARFDGTERVIYPFIEAGLVAEPGDSSSLHDEAILQRYARILLAFDEYAGNHGDEIQLKTKDSAPFNQLEKPWQKWIEHGNLLQNGYLTEAMLERAQELVESYRPMTKPRFQHGDMVPWHFFALENGIWMSFDGEHASTKKARFYDIAYSYARLATTAHDGETARKLLKTCLGLGVKNGQFTEQEFIDGIMAPLMTRSIGMFLDAKNDCETNDYLAKAQDLFARVISKDFTNIINR